MLEYLHVLPSGIQDDFGDSARMTSVDCPWSEREAIHRSNCHRCLGVGVLHFHHKGGTAAPAPRRIAVFQKPICVNEELRLNFLLGVFAPLREFGESPADIHPNLKHRFSASSRAWSSCVLSSPLPTEGASKHQPNQPAPSQRPSYEDGRQSR